MPTSGKPAFNPFASAKSTEAANLYTAGSVVEKPARPSVRRVRGISVVGTEEDRLTSISMRRATAFSAILHVISPVVLTLVTLLVLLILSWILHFNFWDLFKPKAPPRDLEFTLVHDTQATKPDKALFKGNFNQRAGGKQNPTQPLKAAEDRLQAGAASKAKTAEKPQPIQKPQPMPPQAAQPEPKPAVKPEPPKKQAQESTSKPLDAKTEPDTSKTSKPMPKAESASTATSQSETQIMAMGQSSSGLNAGSSSMINPQSGETPDLGVDVEADVDFGPFMADLERRIKRNWVPPRGAESRKVMVLFYLARDGRVMKIETKKSSGDEAADRAAIAAVQASAPFQAFPPQVKEDLLPVEFTFDYNVLNPKNPKQALKW